MRRLQRIRVVTLAISILGIALLALAAHVSFARQAYSNASKMSSAEPVPALTPYVEEHTHFDEKDIDATIQTALAARGRQNAAMIFLQIPPDTFDHPGHYDAEVILPAAKKYPGKLAVVGGGGTLNAMIIQAAGYRRGGSGRAGEIQGAS